MTCSWFRIHATCLQSFDCYGSNLNVDNMESNITYRTGEMEQYGSILRQRQPVTE